MKLNRFLKQFNWRFLLVRIVVNALALAVTAAIVPKITFVDKSLGNWLLMAIMLGVLNALLKPVLQFLTLQFIFVTYGLVVVLVNAVLLWLLSFLFPDRFSAHNLLWLLVGGLVLGLVSSFLESLLGLTTPIVPDDPAELRRQVEEQARHVDWLAASSDEDGPEEQALGAEPPVPEAEAAEAAVAEPITPGLDEGLSPPVEAEGEISGSDAGASEPSTPAPDEGPSPPVGAEAEPPDSVATPPAVAATSAEAVISVDPESAPAPQEESEEDPS